MSCDQFTWINGRWTIDKAPSPTRLDYYSNWAEWLEKAGDELVSAEILGTPVGITVETPLTIVPGLMLDGVTERPHSAAMLWVSGGELKKPAYATVKIVTTAGRIDTRTLYFNVITR